MMIRESKRETAKFDLEHELCVSKVEEEGEGEETSDY